MSRHLPNKLEYKFLCCISVHYQSRMTSNGIANTPSRSHSAGRAGGWVGGWVGGGRDGSQSQGRQDSDGGEEALIGCTVCVYYCRTYDKAVCGRGGGQ